MKNFKTKYILYLVGLFFIVSCDTEHVNLLETFEKGGTVKATVDPEHSFIDLFGDVNTTTIEFDLKPFDANGSDGELIDRLEISVQFIPSTGTPSDLVPVSTETNLNGKVVYNATDLIALVPGLTAAALSAGDVFALNFNVVMKDGREFGPANTAAQICGTAGSNGTCVLNVNVICPLEADFTGIYSMTDSGGAWASGVTLTNNGGTSRTLTGVWFGFNASFNFDLVCGQVLMNTTYAGVGCGAANPIVMTTPPTPGTYDPTDDSAFDMNVFWVNPCGFGAGTVLTYSLSK